MGEIITLPTKKLLVTQKTIYEEEHLRDLANIFWGIHDGKIDEIPPFPVRKHPRLERYLIVDGHRRSLMYDLFKKEARVFVLRHDTDYMSNDEELKRKFDPWSIKDMDTNIRKRFYRVLELYEEYLEEGIPTTPRELRMKFDFLKNIRSAKKYLKREKFKAYPL